MEQRHPDYPYSLVVQPGNVGIDIDGVYVAFGDYNSEASIIMVM